MKLKATTHPLFPSYKNNIKKWIENNKDNIQGCFILCLCMKNNLCESGKYNN